MQEALRGWPEAQFLLGLKMGLYVWGFLFSLFPIPPSLLALKDFCLVVL